jgi:hypothetical protein
MTALGDSLSLSSLTLYLNSKRAGIITDLTIFHDVPEANIDVSSTNRDVLASLCSVQTFYVPQHIHPSNSYPESAPS